MTQTVGDTIDRCLNVWLLGTFSAQFNTLASGINSGVTELSPTFAAGELALGSILAIDNELMYVGEVDTTNQRLIVVRGVRGTTAASHAAGTPIEVNPRFPRLLVREVMLEEMRAWPNSLYRAVPVSVTAPAGTGNLNVATALGVDDEAIGIIKVRRASFDSFDSRRRRSDGYEADYDLEAPGSLAVALRRTYDASLAYQVLVACKFNVTDFIDSTDLIADVGLHEGMVELLELGAAYRLLQGRGAVRLFPEAEGQSRLSAEVTARDLPSFAAGLLTLRNQAEAREVRRLYRRYGFGSS